MSQYHYRTLVATVRNSRIKILFIFLFSIIDVTKMGFLQSKPIVLNRNILK